MTALVLLSSLLAPASPETPTIEEVRQAWQRQSQVRGTIDLQWQVARDSRSETLGFRPEESPRPGRLQLEGNQARVDQYCLLVPGRDGRLHPQNRERMANRHEFQRVLLDDRLEGINPILRWREVALLVSPSRPLPSDLWGDLVQFASFAPTLASRPDFVLSGEEIEITGRHARMRNRRLPVLKIQREPTIHDEIWVDPKHGYRIVRWLQWTDNEPSGQIDISYAMKGPSQPSGWTVMEFDDQGNVVDFLTAVVTEFRPGVSIPAGTFVVTEADWNNAAGISWRNSLRGIFSWMLYTTWFQILIVAACLGLIIFWQRRGKPSGNPVSDGGPV